MTTIPLKQEVKAPYKPSPALLAQITKRHQEESDANPNTAIRIIISHEGRYYPTPFSPSWMRADEGKDSPGVPVNSKIGQAITEMSNSSNSLVFKLLIVEG